MIYLLPGMGADHRLFSRLDLTGTDSQVLRWVPPGKNDDLGDYARRLLPQIAASDNAVLLGVSLGGMLAVELAKLASFRFKKVILVSSAKTSQEIPFYFRRAGKAGLHRGITAEKLIRMRRLVAPMMNRLGTGYRLFGQMVAAADPAFMDWSIGAVLRWHNQEVPPRVVHIHGTADWLLPARYISGYIPVTGGSHLMIYEKPAVINNVIHETV